MRVSSLASVLLASALCVTAQQSVSLFLPFDPQPLSADVAGVDAAGRTTYIIQKGSIGPEDDGDGFFGTATLVQGDDGASLTYEYANPEVTFTMGLDCQFVNGVAQCTYGVDPETGETITEELPLTYIDAVLGTAAPPAATSTPDDAEGAASSGAPSSSGASDPSQSGPLASRASAGSSSSSGASPEPTDDDGAAVAAAPAVAFLTTLMASMFWVMA